MSKQNQSFLGTGWAFPPSFSNNIATAEMVSNEDDIEQSIHILLSTRPGERVMQPTYGCNMDELVFEPVNTTLITYMSDLVKTAIINHEPRVLLNRVNISESLELEGLVLIEVDYTVRATNSRFNYVYPFYKNENTDPGK